MEFYEATLTCHLNRDIHYAASQEVVAKAINKSMLLDKELSTLHHENSFKLYSFNSFYPVEEDKTYKQGRIYILKIRSLYKTFIIKLSDLLQAVKNEAFRIIAVDIKTVKERYIASLYTITPTLITLENNKHWLPGDDFILLLERFQASLEKKYNAFTGKEVIPMQNFIQSIALLNKKPFSIPYKNTKMLGNKFKINIQEDTISQKLAFIAAATGLGEKSSSLGMGFCRYEVLK